MMKLLKKLFAKKVKVLIVVNKDVHEPIDYCNKVDVSLETELRAAFNSLAIAVEDSSISRIAKELEADGTYCYGDEFGFQLLDVEV